MANDPMRYEVRNPEIEGKLRRIASNIDSNLPSGYGFTLMIYSFGPGGSMFYASNANREDMIRAMQEFIAKYREN